MATNNEYMKKWRKGKEAKSNGYAAAQRAGLTGIYDKTDGPDWQKKNREHFLEVRKKNRALHRVSNLAGAIAHDSRRSDKKSGRKNDLTLTFIRSMVSQACSYCGETEIRMTLDRVDNSIGHLMSNVVPACIRCNYARGNMPHIAWLFLIEGMKKAREAGAFGEWIGRMTFTKNW